MENDECLGMYLDILEESPLKECNEIFQHITNKEIDGLLDMKIRSLYNVVPYHLFAPHLKELVGLTITTDEQCIVILNNIRNYVKNKDSIDKIIEFINNQDITFDEIVPEADLIEMLGEIPNELIPDLFNCIDYIGEISEFGSDEE